MQVHMETVAVAGPEVRLDPVDGQVHLGELPGRRVGLLTVHGDVRRPAAVGFDELLALHEHPARAATGVEDASFIGGQHLDEDPDDALRGVELPALLPLGAGEPGQEVFIDAAEDVLRPRFLLLEPDAGDLVHEFAQPRLVQRLVVEVLRENPLQPRVLLLDADHRIVDQFPDPGTLRLRLDVGPAGELGHPEDILPGRIRPCPPGRRAGSS